MRTLSAGHAAISACVTDGTTVYFADGSSLLAIPVTGGSATSFGGLGGASVHLGLSATSVVASVADATPSVLRTFRKTDGQATDLFVSGGTVLSDGGVSEAGAPSSRLLGFAIEEPNAFLFEGAALNGELLRVPLGGGPPTQLATGPADLTSFAYDTRYIYAAFSEYVGLVPKSGGTPSTLVSGLPLPPNGYERGLVAIGDTLFWAAGNSVRYVVGASAQTNLVDAAAPVAFLAADATYVYYATIDPGSHVGRAKWP